VNRYVVLYLATLIVLIPIDFLFLGTVARDFFSSEVGDMLGEIRLAPAILFYLLYVVGILIFVSGQPGAIWQSTLLYGALFGFFCYPTFELTSLSLLKHWTWPVGHGRCDLGHVRDRGVADDRADDRQLDRAQDLVRRCEDLTGSRAYARPGVSKDGSRRLLRLRYDPQIRLR